MDLEDPGGPNLSIILTSGDNRGAEPVAAQRALQQSTETSIPMHTLNTGACGEHHTICRVTEI